MKNFNTLFLSTLGLLAGQAAQAQQSIGNGATPPRTGTMLDVNGPLATAEAAVAATGTTAPTATIATATGQVQLTTGTATAGPITVSYTAPANAGQRLVIYNSTALAATFNSQDIPAGQAVEFVYSNSGWRTTTGGSNVAATNGLTKTGNAIGLGGTLAGPTSINQNGNAFNLTGGNVGIGTTSPTQTLDVNGNARLRGLTTAGIVTTDANGNLGSASAASLDATTASNGLTKTGNDITLGGTLAGPTSINQNGNNFGFTNGRVGIATNNPYARLDIRGGNRRDGSGGDVAIAFSSSPGLGLNTHRHFISTRHAPVLQDGFGGNSIDFYLNNSGNSDTFSPSPGVGNIQAVTFDNNNGEARVGIATTAPTRALDVVGNARVRGLTTAGIVTTDASGNLGSASAASLDATTASNGLTKNGVDVQLGGTLARATTVSGITAANTMSFVGTSAAEAAVTVGLTDGTAGRFSLGNANHGIMRNLTGSTGGLINDVALYSSDGGGGGRLFLASNPQATGSTGLPLGQFTLLPNGNVGLGLVNPGSRLHLRTTGGNGSADDDVAFETYTGAGPAGTTLFFSHARGTAAAPANLASGDLLHNQVGSGYINGSFQPSTFINNYYTGDGTTNRSYMQFGTSGAERLRLTENGALRMASYGNNATSNGLLTTTPAGYLAVAADGTIMQTTGSSAPNLYTVDGSIVNDRTVTLAGHTINFLGSTGNFQFNATGNTFSTSANQLVITQTGDQFGSASIALRNRNAQNGLQVTTANQTTGKSQIGVTDLFLQTQSNATGYKMKQMNLRLESRATVYGLGPYSASVDSLEVQIGKPIGVDNGPSLVAGNNYALAPNFFGVGSGRAVIGSRMTISPGATESKITLFDGAPNGQAGAAAATTHYGFGISNSQLNYDVMSGASHVFYVNSKNGSGSEVFRTNDAGTYLQTAGGPQLAITTTRGVVGSAVPANADGNVYYDVLGLENHVFGGNVVPNRDNYLSLGLSGARWSTVYATNGVIQTSDSRLKTHIENSAYGLKDVLKMRPVTYNWKSQPTSNHMVGFIAQELEQVVPEAVVAPKAAGEYYGVKYEELIPVLTKAIQEQQAQIEALKTANAKLQAQASSATQAQAELQDVKASLLTLAEQVKQLQAGGATATTK